MRLRKAQIFSNEIYGETVAIHAPKRTGKTLTGVSLIDHWLKTREYDHVFSNVALDLSSHNIEFKIFDDIEMVRKVDGHSILYLDELRRFVDSRMGMSMKNRLISNILADTGKNKIDFIYTDQDAMAVEKRVRLNADTVLVPSYDMLSGYCFVRAFDGYDDYFDCVKSNDFMSRKITFVYYARPLFKLYDTEQKIDDFIIKLKPENYIDDYLEWAERKEIAKHSIAIVKVWVSTEASDLSKEDCSILYTYMKEVAKVL